MKLNYGCAFGSDNLIVIQLSEEIQNSVEIADAMKQIIQKENIRRMSRKEGPIAYSIKTSEKLLEQFPEVAEGSFCLVDDVNLIQEADMGRVFMGHTQSFG